MAGDSARRKYEELREERQQLVRDNWRVLAILGVAAVAGGAGAAHALFEAWWLGALLVLAPLLGLLAPSTREIAWRKGAQGEQAVGRALDRLERSSRALHDRCIPGSRANIDHILVATTGVWTIDAKNYTGKLETRRRGTELWVNGRNRSKLLDQARRQTEVVNKALAAHGLTRVPVRPALCFVGVEWPLLFRPKAADGVALVSPRGLGTLTEGTSVIPPSAIEEVTAALHRSLRPALGPDEGRPSSTPAATPPTQPQSSDPLGEAHDIDDLTVKPWKRYRKNRLYVNHRDGTTLGYVDLATNEVVTADEHHRNTVREAASAYLRRT